MRIRETRRKEENKRKKEKEGDSGTEFESLTHGIEEGRAGKGRKGAG